MFIEGSIGVQIRNVKTWRKKKKWRHQCVVRRYRVWSFDLDRNRLTANTLRFNPVQIAEWLQALLGENRDSHLFKESLRKSMVTMSVYDWKDRLIEVWRGGVKQATMTYNALDRLVEQKDANGKTTSYVYDSLEGR